MSSTMIIKKKSLPLNHWLLIVSNDSRNVLTIEMKKFLPEISESDYQEQM